MSGDAADDQLPFPLVGTTLVVGPSNVGKTRLTARALDAWVRRHGSTGVVVLEFGPAHEHEGRLLGGRLTRFTNVPGSAWYGQLDAHAPRAESDGEAAAVDLAADNAERAGALFDELPGEPRAVFVNDATIPFQHEAGEPARLTEYCDRAAAAVCNAFESDELGTDDPVSRQERAALDDLRHRADRVVELD